MKRFLTATIIALCILPAMAATKCVKLDPTVPVSGTQTEYNQVPWTAFDDINGFMIHGLAGCVTSVMNSGSSGETTEPNLFDKYEGCRRAASEATTLCVCFTFAPYYSYYVYAGSFGDAETCESRCHWTCKNYMKDTTDEAVRFRTALYTPRQ